MTTKISETTNILFTRCGFDYNPHQKQRNQYDKKEILMQAAFLIAAVSTAFAQGDGTAGITEATIWLPRTFDPGPN
jgi:hypothetical protein